MEALIGYLQQMDPIWAYLLLFISAYVENIFPPVPGDTVTVIGAYLVGRGVLDFWGVFIATTAGSIVGFMSIFAVAYWLGWGAVLKYFPKRISKRRIDKTNGWIHDYGYWVILLNRFLSGARSVISLVSGLSKMKPLRTGILALISCAVWNGILIYLGSYIGKNWQQIIVFLKIYNRFAIGFLILAIIVFIVIRYHRKQNRTSA